MRKKKVITVQSLWSMYNEYINDTFITTVNIDQVQGRLLFFLYILYLNTTSAHYCNNIILATFHFFFFKSYLDFLKILTYLILLINKVFMSQYIYLFEIGDEIVIRIVITCKYLYD